MRKPLIIMLSALALLFLSTACGNTAGRETGAPPQAQAGQVEDITHQDENAKAGAALNTVYLSITGVDEQISILPREEFEIAEGETVFDLLLRVTRSKKIQMEFSGTGATAFVKGIDNLYEFDWGEGSGWMVYVNGALPDKGIGAWTLNTGDVVEWKYTKDSGRDIGADS